jgi:hypothetical protein
VSSPRLFPDLLSLRIRFGGKFPSVGLRDTPARGTRIAALAWSVASPSLETQSGVPFPEEMIRHQSILRRTMILATALVVAPMVDHDAASGAVMPRASARRASRSENTATMTANAPKDGSALEDAKTLVGTDPAARSRRINLLLQGMDSKGVSRLAATMDFCEAGIMTKEEAVAASGVDPKLFSHELVLRRRERRAQYRARNARR